MASVIGPAFSLGSSSQCSHIASTIALLALLVAAHAVPTEVPLGLLLRKGRTSGTHSALRRRGPVSWNSLPQRTCSLHSDAATIAQHSIAFFHLFSHYLEPFGSIKVHVFVGRINSMFDKYCRAISVASRACIHTEKEFRFTSNGYGSSRIRKNVP